MSAASRTPIVVMASGEGSGFESLARAVARGELAAEIRALISDRPEAPVLEKARKAGVRAISVPFERAGYASVEEAREAHDGRVLAELAAVSPRFLVMAGYMRIVSPRLIEAFRSERGYTRIVNIHPSLLPAFPGVGAYGQAYRHGAKVAGATVHLVESEVDSGPICAQRAFAIDRCRSEAEVEAQGKEIEHQLYPETLSWVLPEKFESFEVNRRLCVRPY